jgi:CPA2 family monovalent cation:H+ antiporter-2
LVWKAVLTVGLVNAWTILQDALFLLLGAMLLGALFERFKQNAVLGYLLAGALLGPNAFDVLPNRDTILSIAELGVTLLLFAIGMEFSWRKLRRIGSIALGGGTLQVLVTMGAAAWVGRGFGLDRGQAIAVGAMMALSSTALVTRLLFDRAEIDSLHGRSTVGILLLQDIAVVPLVILVTALAGDASTAELGWEMARALFFAFLLVAAVVLILKYVFPRLVGFSAEGANRDLPALLAIVTAVGCAWGAHALGLSPLLGAFVGGVMLAESPFATQVRADLSPLKALFVTLFFAAIGTLTNPQLVAEHWGAVGALTVAIVFGKAIIVFLIARLFRLPLGASAATGLCLAQIGEFSFVLLDITRHTQLIGADLFELIVSVIVVTLFLTPYLMAFAPRVARFIERRAPATGDGTTVSDGRAGHVVLVGFGPAGQAVAEHLRKEKIPLVLIEWNPALARRADAMGIDTIVGDATKTDVLTHAGVGTAKAIAITVPDPTAAGTITAHARAAARDAIIVTRSRYQRWNEDLVASGATSVLDEETGVGLQMASEIQTVLDATVE